MHPALRTIYYSQSSVEVIPLPTLLIDGGQSNSLGDASSSTATDLDDLPAQYQGTFSYIKFWNGAAFENANSATNNNQLVNKNGGFGPNWMAAHRLYELTGETVYVVPYAVGGTSIAQDALGAGDWYPDSEGELYDLWQTEITQAKAWLLSNGVTYHQAVTWYQGESDVGADSPLYNANLTYFIKSMRTFLGGSNVPWIEVACQTSYNATNQASWEEMLQAQRDVAHNVAADVDLNYIYLVENNGQYETDQDAATDNTQHLNSNGQYALGISVGNAVYNAIYESGIDSTAPTISSADLSGSNRYIDLYITENSYANANGTGDLTTSDFNITFNQNGGTATAVSISSVETTYYPCIVRLNLSITGTPNGSETIEVKPVSNSVFDRNGNAMSTTQTSGVKTLNAYTDDLTNIWLALDAYQSSTVLEGTADTAEDGDLIRDILDFTDNSLKVRETNTSRQNKYNKKRGRTNAHQTSDYVSLDGANAIRTTSLSGDFHIFMKGLPRQQTCILLGVSGATTNYIKVNTDTGRLILKIANATEYTTTTGDTTNIRQSKQSIIEVKRVGSTLSYLVNGSVIATVDTTVSTELSGTLAVSALFISSSSRSRYDLNSLRIYTADKTSSAEAIRAHL
jgi:hypothetical protein